MELDALYCIHTKENLYMKAKRTNRKGRIAGSTSVTIDEAETIEKMYAKAQATIVRDIARDTDRSVSTVRRVVFGTLG